MWRQRSINHQRIFCHQILHHYSLFCMIGLKIRWQRGDHFGLFVEILPTRLWGRCVINFNHSVLFFCLDIHAIWWCDIIFILNPIFVLRFLEAMISWIFQWQLCIKVILLGTPAQKQRPKPREGAEKCVQDSLRKASRRLDLFKRPKKSKSRRGVWEESAKRMV